MNIRDDIPEDVREALARLVERQHTFTPEWHEMVNAIRSPDPIEPPIPWKYIDNRWRWMAMDSDGEWWVYGSRPVCDDKEWDSAAGGASSLLCPPGADRHWTQTLIERPEGE